MTHVPFDTRSVKYDEHHFIKEVSNKEEGSMDFEDILSEPYKYFNGMPRKNGAGFGNVRHERRRKFIHRKQIDDNSESVKLDDLKKEKDSVPTKGFGVLVEYSPNEKDQADKASHRLVGPEKIAKKKGPNKRKLPQTSESFFQKSPITSLTGRSAFKPSLILSADQPKPKNIKRIKSDIFGNY
jgi:hypothetical protein